MSFSQFRETPVAERYYCEDIQCTKQKIEDLKCL
jgi:hypothetical protein